MPIIEGFDFFPLTFDDHGALQSRQEFDANWDRQVGCPDQYDKSVSSAVWSEMLASDPVGRTWGSGVRRAKISSIKLLKSGDRC